MPGKGRCYGIMRKPKSAKKSSSKKSKKSKKKVY